MDLLRQAIDRANQSAIALHQRGMTSKAAAAALDAYKEARDRLPPEDDLRRRVTMNAAALAELADAGETAILLYTEALDVADALGDVAIVGQALDRLFAIHRERDEVQDAIRAGERSLGLWRARGDAPTEVVLTFMNNLAQMHYRADAAAAAAALLEEVITARQRLSPGDTPALALAFLNLGTVRKSQGNFVSAESHMLTALAIRRRLYEAGDRAIVDALEHLSDLYESQQDYRRAIPYADELLEIARRSNADPTDAARMVNNAATIYYRAGEVARSRPLYEQALDLVRAAHGTRHMDTAVAMGNLANALRQLQDFDGAARLLREVLATRRELLGDTHGHVATAIDDLTELHRAERSADALEKFYRVVWDILLRLVDDPNASTAPLLKSLQKIERAHALLAPDRSRSLAQIEARRRKEKSTPWPLSLANLMFYLNETVLAAELFTDAQARSAPRTLEWSLASVGLAAALAEAGDLSRAEHACDSYIDLVRGGWHAPSDHYASIWRTKSKIAESRHQPKTAIDAMREAVAQSGRTRLQGGAANYARNLVRLSELQLGAGELNLAAEAAKLMLEQASSTVDPVIEARARAVLAQVARQDGRIVDAEALFRAAVAPLLAAEPTWITACVLREFGLMYVESVGDIDRAKPLIERAAAIAESLFGKQSWQYADLLATLAEVEAAGGKAHLAVQLFVEVAEIAGQIDSPALAARAYRGSGALYTRLGASAAAEDMLTRALTSMTRHQSQPAEIAQLEVDLAMTEARLQKYDAACERIDRAIAVLCGVDRPSRALAQAFRTRMWICGRMSRWGDAFAAACEVSYALDTAWAIPLSIASASERDKLAAALYAQLDMVLSLAVRLGTPAAVAEACDRTLRWKGVALTWSASQLQGLADSNRAEISALRRDFVDVRRKIIERMIGGPETEQGDDTPLEELQRREEVLDREIARELSAEKASRMQAASQVVNVHTVRAALPPDGALIDYVRYEWVDFDRSAPSGHLHAGQHRYAAFVIRPGADPSLYDLGDADAIDRAVNRFRSAIVGEADPGGAPAQGPRFEPNDTTSSRSDATEPVHLDWRDAGGALRRVIFDPMLEAIGSVIRLSLGQHGELTRVPFAALPIEGGCLIDRYELTSLDTGRDLLRPKSFAAEPAEPLVLANPDFDLELDRVPASERKRPFMPLPGTRDEGKAVAAILGVAPLLGSDARDSQFGTARSPRTLHIATHGFFLTDDRPPPPSNLFDEIAIVRIPGYGDYAAHVLNKPREVDDGSIVDRLTRMGRLPDPLLRSGVALAGSNTWMSGRLLLNGDDGLLTAAEIALLDLRSTDLAVLSACETGLGEVRRGEGIYGLRRAFAIAGVSALVMSLWKIPDAQTRDLMIEFYRRSAAGDSFSRALRTAQLHVRHSSPHPRMWAGMHCIGQQSMAR